VEDWELHFREKSARRARGRLREDQVKAGVLWLLFGGLAAAACLSAFGIR